MQESRDSTAALQLLLTFDQCVLIRDLHVHRLSIGGFCTGWLRSTQQDNVGSPGKCYGDGVMEVEVVMVVTEVVWSWY